MGKPTIQSESNKKQGDKFETLIDEATPDESERKRRQSAAEEDVVNRSDDDEEE